ncbi:cyclase family protein [Peribacillus frigoritolerans]|uniref:cyclase family protein n=2 Tax=Bacillaceae TaxID=186817 RepID=UPI002E1EC836|nr:cyclase family protein [Peribacillus frigoritolerans]
MPLINKIRRIPEYLKHKKLLKRSSFPDNMFLSNEFLSLSVHCGTHIDAPFHFGPYCEGERAQFIHELPLEWFISDGVVLDLTHKLPNTLITEQDIKDALFLINYTLKPFDIVLIRTDFDLYWPKKDYFAKHPGMSRQATEWLISQGIKIIGIDTNGFDLPFMQMTNSYLTNKDPGNLWPSHMLGREKHYLHIERLANLRNIPVPYGFKVSCLPILIKDVGASWIRAVAII